jgi:hypothetical protein
MVLIHMIGLHGSHWFARDSGRFNEVAGRLHAARWLVWASCKPGKEARNCSYLVQGTFRPPPKGLLQGDEEVACNAFPPPVALQLVTIFNVTLSQCNQAHYSVLNYASL